MNIVRVWKTTLTLCIIWMGIFLVKTVVEKRKLKSRSLNAKKILWWGLPSDPQGSQLRNCGFQQCYIGSAETEDWTQADGILFYASSINISTLPIPRRPQQLWALLHEESPRNAVYLLHERIIEHFNLTSTFSRYSDRPLLLNGLQKSKHLFSQKYMKTVAEKNLLRNEENLAPILFMQSDCSSMSGREAYVKELMQYIEVDSYGACLNNKELPDSLKGDYLNALYSEYTLRFLARYKFVLAYENGVCHDYITEKLWRPLVVGSIPIYYGSPTIRDWSPTNKSIVYIEDFPSPKELAAYIKLLDANDNLYNSYLDHKFNKIRPTTNTRLEKALYEHYDEDGDGAYAYSDFFGDFACFVCQQLNQLHPNHAYMANRKHYECPVPLPYPPMEKKVNSFWSLDPQLTQCFSVEFDKKLRGLSVLSIKEMGLKCAVRINSHYVDFN